MQRSTEETLVGFSRTPQSKTLQAFSQARGAMLLISAGPDGIYFSSWDGPGSQDEPQNNWGDIDENQAGLQPLTEAALREYDDILRFIGS